MTRIDLDLVSSVATFADDLDHACLGVEEARTGLEALRAAFPDHRLDLVADTETFDGTTSYDLIVRQGNGLTVSLAVTSGRQLPWPLRGVTRASELDLVRVGTVTLSVADALATVDYLWDDRSLLVSLIDACIIASALADEPVELPPAELQAAADAFRRAKGLLSAQDTERWLGERSLSPANFADLVARSATAAALRRRVVADRVEPWFAAHRSELARLVVAWAAGPAPADDPASCDDRSLGGDPLAAVVAAQRAGRAAGVGAWLVCDLPGHLSALNAVPPGTVIEVDLDGVAGHAMVLESVPAVFDAAARDAIERRLFDQWLADQRREVEVEWFWGNAGRTAKAG
jgi:putative peptide maturation system protein